MDYPMPWQAVSKITRTLLTEVPTKCSELTGKGIRFREFYRGTAETDAKVARTWDR